MVTNRKAKRPRIAPSRRTDTLSGAGSGGRKLIFNPNTWRITTAIAVMTWLNELGSPSG